MDDIATLDLPPNVVRVKKLDARTGEIIAKVIPARDFRPRPPKTPKQLDERRITRVERSGVSAPTGRSVVYMLTHREAVVDYWAYYAHILTPAERRQLAEGRSSSVLRTEVEPEWRVGDRMYVARDMEAEVIEVTEGPRGFGTVFRVHDYSVRYLRRGVLGDAAPKTDEDGYPAALTPAEQERARLDGAYTTIWAKAVDDAGAIMDDDALQRIHPNQSATDALTRSKGKAQLTKGRLLRRIEEAKAKNRRSTVRYLERQLASLESKLAA